jgi:hypothetical protein
MEPQWTKSISSELVCNYFYVFFVIYAVIAVITLIATIGVFSVLKKAGAYGIASGVGYLFATALAATQALFFYLICDRALITKVAEGFIANQ